MDSSWAYKHVHHKQQTACPLEGIKKRGDKYAPDELTHRADDMQLPALDSAGTPLVACFVW